MSVSHRYRNFGGGKPPKEETDESETELLEEQKLQAFEAGYQAGWDDATKAQSDERDKVTAELSQNLLDMSFTYHEALSKLTASLEPAMQKMVGKLLPEIAQHTLGTHILEQVQSMMSGQLKQPIEIVVNPKNISSVEQSIGSNLIEPFEVKGEASLGDGQAFVRIGNDECQVDLDTILTDLSNAVGAFFHEATREGNNE
ncbi:MAG: ABC transporter ATP-binding protein [Roseobacter sp.]